MNHLQETPERDELKARFTAWLEAVVKHAKVDYVRKYKQSAETISLESVPEEFLLSEESEEKWIRAFRKPSPYDFEEARLTKAFLELPLKRRKVMELLFLEDLSEAETAKRLNCSVQYVRNQRCIALKKLRSSLTEGGDDD